MMIKEIHGAHTEDVNQHRCIEYNFIGTSWSILKLAHVDGHRRRLEKAIELLMRNTSPRTTILKLRFR